MGGGEIGGVVRAKTEVGAGGGFVGERVEKLRLHEAVFVVAAFGPRIGKKHKYPLKNNMRRQRADDFGGFGSEKNEVGEFGAVAFAQGAFDAVAEKIAANAELGRVGSGVVGEEVAVPGTDFERDAWVRREQFAQFVLELGATGVAVGDKFGGAGGSVHGARLSTAGRAGASPRSAGRRFGDAVLALGQREIERGPLP